MSKVKVSDLVSELVSELVTRSPIELFWTAKNVKRSDAGDVSPVAMFGKKYLTHCLLGFL